MAKVLNAFLAGIVTGLLFAPRSGKKTREKIADIFNGKGNKLLRYPYTQEAPHNIYENIELEDKKIIEPSDYAQQ